MSKKYNINVYGYGGEIAIGKISSEAYEFWKEREIEGENTLDEYSADWDREMDIPEEFRIFGDGDWYDCDDVAHSSGAEMCSATTIEVTDEDGNEIWSSTAEPYVLEENNADCEEFEEVYVEELPEGTCVIISQSVEKGTFYGSTFETESEFDPSKLKINYNDINGWMLLYTIEYDGEDVYNDDFSTTGKGLYFELYKVEPNEEA
jgi:hypothetical protein